jgi:hypothetical protein
VRSYADDHGTPATRRGFWLDRTRGSRIARRLIVSLSRLGSVVQQPVHVSFGGIVTKITLALLLTTTAFFGVPAARATPIPDPAVGAKCHFHSVTDVTREAGWQIGAIGGGPIVGTQPGVLHCSIHVNNNTHNGSSSVKCKVDPPSLVARCEEEEVNFQATAADDVSLCTEYSVGATTYYWVSGNTTTGDLGHWDNDPNSSCGVALSIEPNDPECSIWLAIDERAGTNIAETWQDCEPYKPII